RLEYFHGLSTDILIILPCLRSCYALELITLSLQSGYLCIGFGYLLIEIGKLVIHLLCIGIYTFLNIYRIIAFILSLFEERIEFIGNLRKYGLHLWSARAECRTGKVK